MGRIYVVDLGVCVKVGRSNNAVLRVHNHLWEFNRGWADNFWISKATHHDVAAETTLIRETRLLYPTYQRREYFDGDFEIIRALAKDIVTRKVFSW